MGVTDPVSTAFALLYGVLHGDATLLSLVSGIFQVAAPPGTTPDYIVINSQSATDTNSAYGSRLLTRCLMQVQVVGPVEHAANLRAAFARLDALLQPAGQPLRNQSNTLACFREQALSYGEVRSDGALYLHYGGLYRVEV